MLGDPFPPPLFCEGVSSLVLIDFLVWCCKSQGGIGTLAVGSSRDEMGVLQVLTNLSSGLWLGGPRALPQSPRRAAALLGSGLPRCVLVPPHPVPHQQWFSNVNCRVVAVGRQDFGVDNIRTKHKLACVLWCCCSASPCFWLEGSLSFLAALF